MAFYNRREFIQSFRFGIATGNARNLTATPSSPARIQETGKFLRVEGKVYVWEWSPETDDFRILDRWGLAMAHGKLQPAVLVQPEGESGAPRCTLRQTRQPSALMAINSRFAMSAKSMAPAR